jgi:hypothetical protein
MAIPSLASQALLRGALTGYRPSLYASSERRSCASVSVCVVTGSDTRTSSGVPGARSLGEEKAKPVHCYQNCRSTGPMSNTVTRCECQFTPNSKPSRLDQGLRQAARPPDIERLCMVAVAQIVDAADRLRGVFQEMPKAQLTLAVVSRLSGLERPLCSAVLEALEGERFVARTMSGAFVKGPRSFADCKPRTADTTAVTLMTFRDGTLLRKLTLRKDK